MVLNHPFALIPVIRVVYNEIRLCKWLLSKKQCLKLLFEFFFTTSTHSFIIIGLLQYSKSEITLQYNKSRLGVGIGKRQDSLLQLVYNWWKFVYTSSYFVKVHNSMVFFCYYRISSDKILIEAALQQKLKSQQELSPNRIRVSIEAAQDFYSGFYGMMIFKLTFVACFCSYEVSITVSYARRSRELFSRIGSA